MEYFLHIKAALEYIERHVREEMRPADIARISCFSLSHFHTVFKAAVGVPLASYIRRRRLCNAAKELVETDRSVLDVALRYGFDSHEAFTRAFQRELGCTPSGFRRAGQAMESGLIVPGIFGPMPPGKERAVSEFKNGLEKGTGGAVVHGVPKVSYFKEPVEVTPFPSSFRSCLSAMGQETAYADLMAASGAAFRLMWNSKSWDGGNVDILCFLADPTEPLRRACRAAGRSMDLLCRREGDLGVQGNAGPHPDVRSGGKAEFIDLIRREVDAGRPLIGFGIIGPPEACVITGYREDGEALLGWNYFQEMPEFSAGMAKTDEGYFIRRGWYEHPQTIMVMAIGDAGPMPEARTLAVETIALAVEVMNPRRVRDHIGGLDAFDAWAGALEKPEEFPQGAPLHQLIERMMCMGDALTMVGEGRWYAHSWLERIAGELDAAERPLKAASAAFKGACDVTWEMWALLGGMGMGEKQARALAKPDVRLKCIKSIAKAKDKDRVALESLKEALRVMRS